MAHGNAASDDEATEELLPEDVATAAQTTHRRPKRPEPPGGVTGTLRGTAPTAAELELQSGFDIPMVDFGDPLPPVSAPVSPPPISQSAASQPAADPYLGR